jgi:alginate O-acetyltransferase complex protein AlgI
MTFNQLEFLFIFLPLAVGGFFMPGLARFRPWWLVGVSLVFYGLSGWDHAAVLCAGLFWVHLITRFDAVVGNRALAVLASIGPLLALAYYKYSKFLVHDVLGLMGGKGRSTFSLFDDVILPAGISFFTFQLVAYAIDRYRGKIKQHVGLVPLAVYITFFPQLVAGPIVRYMQVNEAINGLRTFRPNSAAIAEGVAFAVFGLALKVLVADGLARYVDVLSLNPAALGPVAAYYLVFAFSMQIYFDFYGYSLMAIGLGRFFGFTLPDNFLRPYEALNPKDFWRRWHVSLSYWIRDYLYLPLGGNKRYLRNILIVFALCGLWHGSGFNFVLWGLFHAILVIGYRWSAPIWDSMPRIVQIALTFFLVSFGWVFFLFKLNDMATFGLNLLGLSSVAVVTPVTAEMWSYLAGATVVCYFLNPEKVTALLRRGTRESVLLGAVLGVVFFSAILFLDRSQNFIYFRF